MGAKWALSDELWDRIKPLLPVVQSKPHPLECHRQRVDNRAAMTAILFVLHTGCCWNALNSTGICSSSSAHRRFLEWLEAGVFERFWQTDLLQYDEVKDIDWSWLATDGALGQAPRAGTKKRVPTRRTGARKVSSAASDRH
ncbi:transposase [Chitinimonas arctica]|uniref:Transposase n=1 Tax=Chitinimonas arctica TaxID=2594795 RepID=A0A516SL58_9NEIS|nr:transposase [Chitinimonas arctica]